MALRRGWVVWVAAALGAALIWRTFVEPRPMYDLHTFLRAAHAVLHGRDPYPHVPSAALLGGHAFVYPWLTAHLFVPLALLPRHLADVTFFALSCAAVVAACRVARVPHRWTAVVVLLAATTIRGLQVGSLNPLLLLGGILAWHWRERPWRVAAMLTLVIGTKLFLAPLLVWLLLARRWRALGLSVAGVGAFLGLGFLLGPIGPGTYRHLLSLLSQHERAQGFSLDHLLAVDHAGTWITPVLTVGLLLVAWALTHHGHLDEVTVFSVAVVAALMSTPILWSHYLLLAALPLLAARASISAFLTAAAVSWLVADPAPMHPLVQMDTEDRLSWLYASLAAMVLVLAVRGWPGHHRGRTRKASASR